MRDINLFITFFVLQSDTMETFYPLRYSQTQKKTFWTLALLMLLIPSLAGAFTFTQNLRVGSIGPEVLELQRVLNQNLDAKVAQTGPGSPGFETNYFGSLTKKAVIRFQEKHKDEVLAPVGLSRGTGFVGSMTLKKLNNLAMGAGTVSAGNTNQSPAPIPFPSVNAPQTSAPKKAPPTVLSVSPDRVRRGDVVNVTGTNFAPTGNAIILGDGPVNKRFENLNSFDGKTIAFVYQPPIIKTMSEAEIRTLPAEAVGQIEMPIKAVGGTLTDALQPYKNIKSEAELKASLEKHGHSFDEIYNFYFVAVENVGGKAISRTDLLHGLRELPIPGLADNEESRVLSSLHSFGQYLRKFIAPLLSIAYAQEEQYGGGLNTGIIMICTCGDGYLTFMDDYNGGGTGLYVFSWGFMANAGAGFITPNWLGGYQTMTGTCSIYVGVECVDISANEPEKPWGTNLF